MDIKGLKALLKIADTGSFGEAADDLGISISSVSLQIASLEKHFSANLFDRKSRPPVLTAAGIELIPKARKLVSDWDELSQNFSSSHQQQHIRIGAVHTSVEQLLPCALKSLRKRQPELQISLSTGLSHDLEKEVINQKLDCALVTLSNNLSPELTATLLFEDAMTVIAHKKAIGTTWHELLKRNPYVRFARHAEVARLIDAELTRKNISVNSTMQIDTLDGVVALVKNGLGVSIVPGFRQAKLLPASIQSIPFSRPVLTRRLGIIFRTDSEKQSLINSLVATIKA